VKVEKACGLSCRYWVQYGRQDGQILNFCTKLGIDPSRKVDKPGEYVKWCSGFEPEEFEKP